jgi:beta-glucosidase
MNDKLGRRVTSTMDPAFIYGTATAAYQIEGATDVDGRLEAIWDRFSAAPGKALNGDSGAQACAHYWRWGEDVALLAELGFGAYRMSLAWPLLMTEDGRANPAGFDFL